MGYALFTARKLSLTTRLNQCNANLMMVSQQCMNITNSIYAKQVQANKETATANAAAYKQYEKAIVGENVTDAQKATAQATLQTALAKVQEKSTMKTLEIQQLNTQQTALDLQKQRLETELNAYSEELNKVKDAEGNAIKNSAPKFK